MLFATLWRGCDRERAPRKELRWLLAGASVFSGLGSSTRYSVIDTRLTLAPLRAQFFVLIIEFLYERSTVPLLLPLLGSLSL